MTTGKASEQKMVNGGENSLPNDAEGTGTSRRKFTRSALIGGAVLLTLSNRSAWGATASACISTNLLVSYANGQASAPNNTQQQSEIDKYYENFDKIKGEEYLDGSDICYDYQTNSGINGNNNTGQ